MDTSYMIPDLNEVTAYMRAAGWRECPPGVAGSIWTNGRRRIGVPAQEVANAELLYGILERLASSEGRPLTDVAESIRYLYVDVTLLKATNDYRIGDTIPLGTAATITTSTRVMLRAAGTTSLGERSEIRGNYITRGDRVVQDARMGHTQQGSFIIPVLVELGHDHPESDQLSSVVTGGPAEHRPPPPPNSRDIVEPLLTVSRSWVEPFARRVTRTFAQSLAAVHEHIVTPAREPTMSRLHAVVERGVSREFCSALARILEERAVGEFNATFRWSPVYKVSTGAPQSVTIEAEAHALLEKAAEKLRVNKIEPKQIFTGKIVELRHGVGDAYGWITISTVRHGRSCEMKVRLEMDEYDSAIGWHRDSRAIVVEGKVGRGAQRRLVIYEPVRCRPIDEDFLTN